MLMPFGYGVAGGAFSVARPQLILFMLEERVILFPLFLCPWREVMPVPTQFVIGVTICAYHALVVFVRLC